MNIFVILMLLSIIPSIILGLIVYNNDRVEKEPLKMIAGLFVGGISVVAFVLCINLVMESYLPFFSKDVEKLSDIELFISMLFGVALIEEGGKWLIFKKLAWNNKEFNYLYDAIVYSVFISLGFATVENMLYVLDGGLWVAIIRSICSVPGHVFFAIYMGYYFGLAKQAQINNKKKLKNNKLIKSLLIPTLLHTFFNYFLFSNNKCVMLMYVLFIILLYIKSFKRIKTLGSISVEMKN